MTTTGRLTLPIQTGLDDVLPALLRRLGADAVRNSDGTELPAIVDQLAAKIYSTYFVGRGDQEWAVAHPDQLTQIYLMSPRTAAATAGPLTIKLMAGWFAEQVRPDVECDLARWWQVIDRTTGQALASDAWQVQGQGAETTVTIADAQAGHVYTVGFLAHQVWDPTQMYNYLTNNWAEEPSRVKEQPYDVRHPETWAHVQAQLDQWLAAHPEVDVVRFTTFFYHFTLVYNERGREGFVDWFGYSASVSVAAMVAFEAEYGYPLQAEDFIDQGYYNSPFRPPSKAFRDWIDFQHRFVTSRVRELVGLVHAAGKQAIMFLGDNWIGTEPYGPHFAETGLDAVVGSVGSGATCRMISDIPHVKYTEGRFLPYFFPDVFNPAGDPVGEANQSWVGARRAIVRSPLDRIGYGGYLGLALEHPAFIDRVAEIVAEFRELHESTAGERPASAPFTVGVLNAWGALRSWQTHMVAHAMWYRQAYSYLGVLEALSGLPFDVEFLSFDQVRAGVPGHIGVLINAGGAGTAFSGGPVWADEQLVASINGFVAGGGGFIGVGEPTELPGGGTSFRLADLLGVDRELGWGLSTNRYPKLVDEHFITADLAADFDAGEPVRGIVPISPATEILASERDSALVAAHRFGAGRSVYLAGLPASASNFRLLHRALYWAAGREAEFGGWVAADPRIECAVYPGRGLALVFNNADEPVASIVQDESNQRHQVELPALGYRWLEL